MFALGHALRSFWRTKRLARRLKTRADVLHWRQDRLERFLRLRIGKVAFYAGSRVSRLEDLPTMDKQTLLANFAAFNMAGVTYEAARSTLDRGEDRIGELIVGQSTGTSGNRGIFLISEAERFTWLGVLLAKTLPDFPFKRHKVALALPGYGRLYSSAAETRRLAIRFFDLSLGVDCWRDELRKYAPDTIVAPPKVLRAIAESGGLAPANVFSGAEVLDPFDRAVIEAGFGARVREIYMATEGLFGVGCRLGTLHLAEDAVAFEWEDASSGLSMPLITDFTRSTQIMARYRMNDLLRLSPKPCACGSPLQAVSSVEGRHDDVFRLRNCAGTGLVLVTPDVLRNAVVDADRRIQDFRIVQTGENTIDLALDGALDEGAFSAAEAGLHRALEKIGAARAQIVFTRGLFVPFDRKLRRVRCEWKPEKAV